MFSVLFGLLTASCLITCLLQLLFTHSAFATTVLHNENSASFHTTYGITFTPSSLRKVSIDIPGLIHLHSCGAGPCWASCLAEDAVCLSAANSVVRTCGPLWDSYISSSQQGGKLGPQWTTLTETTGGMNAYTYTVDVYTTFRKAATTWYAGSAGTSAYQPVYALGSPLHTTSKTTYFPEKGIYTSLVGPSPDCQYWSVATVTDCSQCNLYGGTVDFYYWPPTATGTMKGNLSTPLTNTGPVTAVVKGTTLTSPTVYIWLRTIYARDACSQIGERHTGTMIAMDPRDVSTQIHIGGKVAAYTFGQMHYEDLTGFPPLDEYIRQPDCAYVACPTIYSTSWNPTLSVPSRLRAIDPAWETCGPGIEGL